MNSFDKHAKSIEFDKVLERLADFTSCDDARYDATHLRPESNLDLARALLNQTVDAHMLLARFGGPSFGGLKNVNNALSRANAGSVLNTKELLDIGGVLRVIRTLSQWRASNAGVQTVLDPIFNALVPNKFLETAIFNAIISEEEISDNASPTLKDIRRKIRIQESKVREQLEKFSRSQTHSKFLQENIITQRNGRYVVPVKSEHRNEVAGLVHDTSSSGATVFIEPMAVVEANNEIRVLQTKEREEIERILSALSASAGEFSQSIKNSYECAVELNLIFAKAQYAYKIKAAPPILNNKGIINLRAARHPLIDPKKVVPVDIMLGADFDTLVITGPNTGGKTVSIKTLGLLSMMAMCGLMIPAGDRSEISVFDKILSDIGDEQSIEQSLSTFSAHMTTIIDIFEEADESSLILIDELGAGTDPVEGAALAISILEALHFKGAKIAATTHYAELKAYALETPRVENGCCEFDVATLRPTYRLLIGVPGKSNALAISEKLGLDISVIERAKELVSSENKAFENVVDKLEDTRKRMEDEYDRAKQLSEKAIKEKEEAEKIKAETVKLREKEMENAKSQALRVVEQAKREAYALLQELDKLKKEQQKTKDAAELARRAKSLVKKGIESIDSAADPIIGIEDDDKDYVLPRALVTGDTVIIRDIGKTAKVLSPADKKGNVEVQAGSIKTRVKLSNLRLCENAPKKKETKSTVRLQGESRLNMAASTRLDLRGMTVDECLIELDRFIDQGLRTGLNEFTVVHGKGTGALRTAVTRYLKASPYVKTSRLGVYGEGEDGVTIVTLK
ncbi:MAG: endonuclease MutS2 [Acutalibacteraceae bacterium]|nr:endonuclease MutS2 [Acutalibacteraceae bacterium]